MRLRYPASSEVAAEDGGGRPVAMSELVEHAHLGERERAPQMAVAEHAHLAGVETVERADRVDPRGGDRSHVRIVGQLVDGVN